MLMSSPTSGPMNGIRGAHETSGMTPWRRWSTLSSPPGLASIPSCT